MDPDVFPWLSTLDAVVVVALGAVVPLALGGPVRRWVVAGVAALLAFWLPTGVGGVLVVPVAAVAGWALLERLWAADPGRDGWVRTIGIVGPAVWATVAAGSLAVSRAGWVLLDQHEPFVQLTAVHYLYAGVAALTLARGRFAVLATAAAPPVIAAGFVLEDEVPDLAAASLLVSGAVLLTAGVWATAVLQLREAVRTKRLLLGVSGAAVFVPMVLAVAWAAGTHWDVPHLSVPAMVRFHGLVNAVGFVGAGLIARHGEHP